ncbi:alpha/beta fold hydrolase [Pontibacillus yanchengensis]|uniref:Alpha/beta fold hydrolase n=1 Tax=Pontibacillus yanchengensis TaxID=462910 RepID=A0A6I5A6S1_9BACI|nr:alpha/beta hydrolase [Pontibacillus yanchengensis]MYL36076.1 alpha/beta fold hydrolase [Pontibacillus yanchengensis]
MVEKTIYYKDLGEGLPIVFIHPPGMGHKVFLYQENLSQSYRILLPDLNGHGMSSKRDNPVSIPGFSLDIKEMLDHAGMEKAVICGYSAGSMVAQDFVLSYPERTHAMILSGGYPKVNSLLLAAEYKLGMRLVRKNRERLAYIIARSHTNHPSFQNALKNYMMKADPQVWYEFYHKSYHYDCSERISSVKVPVLLLYGARETWMKKHIPFYNQCSFCTLQEIPKAFHQLPSRQSVYFNRIIDHFLREQAPLFQNMISK